MKQPAGGSGAAEQVHFGCHLQHSAKPKLDSPTLESTHTYMIKTHPIEVGNLQLPVQERKGAGIVLVRRVYDGVYQRASEVQFRNFEGNAIV